MKNQTGSAATPQYVLKSGSQPIYPTVNFDDSTTKCTCVYGFSDKPIYDQFINNASQLLTPYPLVKGYLANQIAEADSAETGGVRLSLVVLDATDPVQSVVSVATMASVLVALQEQAMHTPIVFELDFDLATASYHINRRDSREILPNLPMQLV